MTTKDYIIRTATNREKFTLIIWGVFNQEKLKKVYKNLESGMNVKNSINNAKNKGE